jgi:hypothetical protein
VQQVFVLHDRKCVGKHAEESLLKSCLSMGHNLGDECPFFSPLTKGILDKRVTYITLGLGA